MKRWQQLILAMAALTLSCDDPAATPAADSAVEAAVDLAPPDQAAPDALGPDAAQADVGLPDVTPADAAAPDAVACPAMKVKLPSYTFTPSTVATKDQAFLDTLATQYACSLKGKPVDNVYFMYGWAPVTLFNRIIKGDTKQIAKMRWVLHLSGHFGAKWLRSELNKAQGGSSSGHSGNGSLGNMTAEAKKAATAAAGPASKLYAYNKASLLAFIYPSLGIASNFGYNKGYLLEIYQKPPSSVKVPAKYVSCSGVLWCTYANQRVTALAALKPVATKLAAGSGKYKDLWWAKSSQSVAEVLGHAVWGTFMKKTGIKQAFYDDLLDVSASFVEVVQVAGLLSAKGYAEKDLNAGRSGALVQSGLAIWLGAYMGGFGGNVPANVALPAVVPASKP